MSHKSTISSVSQLTISSIIFLFLLDAGDIDVMMSHFDRDKSGKISIDEMIIGLRVN